jgi:hypothetical protein
MMLPRFLLSGQNSDDTYRHTLFAFARRFLHRPVSQKKREKIPSAKTKSFIGHFRALFSGRFWQKWEESHKTTPRRPPRSCNSWRILTVSGGQETVSAMPPSFSARAE